MGMMPGIQGAIAQALDHQLLRKGNLEATILPITIVSTAIGEMVAADTVGSRASDRYYVVPMKTFVWMAADRSCREGLPLSTSYWV